MKLLFDLYISPRLVLALSDIYPGSMHVKDVELDMADDWIVWEFAKKDNYIIVTKDTDFSEFSLIAGTPPKVIWIRRGNCSTRAIEMILRNNYEEIKQLAQDSELGVLTLL